MRPETDGGGPPSEAGPPAKTSSALRDSSVVPSIPDYDLLRRIDGGAYGEVWLARSVATGAMRAAKIVWRHNFEAFRREFEGIQSFEPISREHPSQLALFHIGRNDREGYFYYVMELADDFQQFENGVLEIRSDASGSKLQHSITPSLEDLSSYVPHTLRAELKRGRLPPARVLEIGLALTEALSHLHRNGLVHRDVKPSNVILVKGRPKLADIGLVTDASDQCSIVGTEGYLPPEGPGTPQADIFALGKLLYEAATGMDRRKFPDLPADLNSWPEAAAVLEINQVVLRACASDVRARYRDAEEVRRDLSQVKESKSLVRQRRRDRRWRNVRRGALWVAGAAVSAGILALVGHMFLRRGTQLSAKEPAHSSYSLGRNYLDRFEGAQDLQMAAAYFQQSTQGEPGFAPAYGCLAYTYTISSYDGWNQGWKDLPKAKEYALQGLKIREVPEAHLALGCYEMLKEWNWEDARGHYEKALALEPSSALCHFSHAEFLRVIGQADDALRELTNAMSLPHPKFLLLRLPSYLVDARHYQDALDAIQKASGSIPSDWVLNTERSALCALGRFDDAIEMDRKFQLSKGRRGDDVEHDVNLLKNGLVAEGAKGYWRAGKDMIQGFERICFYAQAGEKSKALAQLKLALQQRDLSTIFHVMTDWRLDEVRSEPGFSNILKEMNLPQPISEGGLPSTPPIK